MVDPVTLTLGATLLAGAGAGFGASKMMSSGNAVAPPPNIEMPPGLQPAQTPSARPGRRSMQQSFMSGAAAAQQAQVAPSAGKTLIGA